MEEDGNSKPLKNPYTALNPRRATILAWFCFLLVLAIILASLWMIRIPEIAKVDMVLNKYPGEDTEFYIQIDRSEKMNINMKPGQALQLRLDNYPFTKFGYIPAKLKNIVYDTNVKDTLLLLDLPEGLVTIYQNNIVYEDESKGTVVIFIDNTRLLVQLHNLLKRYY